MNMERGRDGRRGGVGGGSVSAPRRPRTIGFKDAPVGEDGDDMMDDVHNSRLRERPKKEGNSSTAVQGAPSSSLGSVSRSKRKRQGSQEVQDQARSSTVDDVDETTEDTEMGVSDDDDDPPPPPIPRRAVKFRPQGKFIEDGPSTDHPAVPRKARTAILKRPQEASSPSVVDASSHQGSAISRTPAPSSAPSSSSVVSLKPGRRTKPVSHKPRPSKVSKMSTQTIISDQEVEVAEALFDLARMFTNQPISASQETTVDSLPESKPKMEIDAGLEVKVEPKNLADFTEGSSVLPPKVCGPSVPASTALLCVSTSQPSTNASPPSVTVCSPSATPAALPRTSATRPDTATTIASPRPSPSPPPSAVVPPAEAPKRKRPRVRTRSDDVGLVPQVPPQGISTNVCTLPRPTSPTSKPQSQQIFTSFTETDGNSVETECGARNSAKPRVVLASMTPPFLSRAALDPSVPGPPVSTQRHIPVGRRSTSPVVAKEEVNNLSAPLLKNEVPVHDQNRAHISERVGSPLAVLTGEIEPSLPSLSGSVPVTSLDLGKRYVQYPSSGSDGVRPKKFDIELRVPLLAKRGQSPGSEGTVDILKSTAKEIQEKDPGSDLEGSPPLLPSERAWMDRDCGNGTEREQEQNNEMRSRECGKEPQTEKNREKECESQKVEHHELNNHIELSKNSDGEKDVERAEFAKESSVQKSVKTLKLESRIPKLDPKAAYATTTSSASSLLVSALPSASPVVTSVSSIIATLPLSVGMAGWPLGLPPIGYYSSGAGTGTTGWSGGGSVVGPATVDEHMPPAAQLQHPYLIQPRQAQPWKRSASHVYIAHFIDAQQQINRHPFMQGAYQNSASLYGAKPYNLNIPLTPTEALFGGVSGGPLLGGGVSGATGESVVTGGGRHPGLASIPGNDRHPGAASALTNAQAKDRIFLDATSRKTVQQLQQPQQLSPSLSLQARPGFGFPVTQVGTAGGVVPATDNGGVPVGDSGSGGGSALVGSSSGLASGSNTVTGPGAGAGNGSVVSHATAQAQYLQAVMQQGVFPFPFQAAAHFGPSFSGPGHQQAAQYFSSPFYAAHLVHAPGHTHQQGQKSTNVSSVVVSNELQHPQLQVSRNFPPASSQQQQQQSMPSSVSPSHSQLQESKVSMSQQMPRLVEREGNTPAESNLVTESKFPLSQRNVYSQGSSNTTVLSVTSPSIVLGGSAGMQSLQSQGDFNLMPGIGGKPIMQLQQNQVASQHHSPLQQQNHHQHAQHGSGQHKVSSDPAIQLSLKGVDQQSPHTFSAMAVAALNRGSTVGPGPLGLAPVAPVMAPQGHAMIQSFSDSSRGNGQHQQPQHHQSVLGKSHQLSLQSGQQQQRAVQMQRGVTLTSGVEDGRTIIDQNTYPSRSGREIVEDRKLPSKRGMGPTLNISRADLDGSASVQGSLSGGGLPAPRISSNIGPALNLLTPPSTILITRPSGNLPGSGLQQPIPPVIQNSKQAMARSKLLTGSAIANLVPASSSQLPSYPDRSLQGASLSNKVSGPALTLPGQNLGQGNQVPRQGQVTQQHAQLKLSNRGPLGSLPTPSGTAPQAVLAAAIAKSQQGVQQQQSRPQTQVGTNTGPSPRLPSGNMGGLPASSSMALLPVSPASKSVPSGTGKSNLSSKGSFTLSHRPSSGVSTKRATPPSGPSVPSILGSSPLGQTPSTKPPLQQQQSQHQPASQLQQSSNQQHTQSSQQPSQSFQQPPLHPPQSLSTSVQQQQYHQQQAHINAQQLHQVHNQQTLMQQQQTHHMQRQVFLQNVAYQQHQHTAGSQVNSLPQPQQSHQQSSVQVHQQVNSPTSQVQPQQHQSSPQLHHQQQHGMQSGAGSYTGAITNGGLCLSPPLLTLGTGSNGNINVSSRTAGSDGGTVSQCSVARPSPVTSKVIGVSGIAPPGSSLQRSNCSAPSFLHAQFGSGVVSGQQQSVSPRNSSGAPYFQPVTSVGAVGVAGDDKAMPGDGNGHEEGSGVRMLSTVSASFSMVPQTTLAASSVIQPLSNRLASCSTSVGKSVGDQLSGISHIEAVGSRCGLTIPPVPPSLSSSSNLANSNLHSKKKCANSGVQSGSDVRPLFGASSSVLSPAAVTSQVYPGSVQQSSSPMPPANVDSNAPSGQSGLLGQTSSIVQS